MDVPAATLVADYRANEVAADEKYKGKLLRVTGTVDSIDKDFMDDIVVRIKSDNMFMSIMANVDDSEKSAAARLAKGGPVTVVCEGGGLIVGSPVLNDCTIE